MKRWESGEFLMLFICSGILKNIYFFLAASDLSCRHTGSSRGLLSCCDVQGSVAAACGLGCHTARGLVPQPGIQPRSPALTGGFLTTEPRGESQTYFLNKRDNHLQETKLRY